MHGVPEKIKKTNKETKKRLQQTKEKDFKENDSRKRLNKGKRLEKDLKEKDLKKIKKKI